MLACFQKPHTDLVVGIAFSPDGAARHNIAPRALATLLVSAMAAPDRHCFLAPRAFPGNYLATGCKDKKARVFDISMMVPHFEFDAVSRRQLKGRDWPRCRRQSKEWDWPRCRR